jgi:hypothetical protein
VLALRPIIGRVVEQLAVRAVSGAAWRNGATQPDAGARWSLVSLLG